jgi:hypothetical protein
MFSENRKERACSNQEAYAAAIKKKLLVNVDSRKDPPIQIVRTHQHINSAVLQTARRLKT